MNLCVRCGKCCWDWKSGDPSRKCVCLADDLKTCLIYDRRAASGPYASCVDFPTPAQACDLPETCGFVVYWRRTGVI